MSGLLKVMVIAFAVAASALPTSSSSAAPSGPTPNTQALFADLFTEPSAVGRFQRLLTDGSGNLLSGDALRSQIVFDYNNGASLDPTDKAGKLTAAVAATFPILVEQDISTVTAFLKPCSMLVPHTHPQIESLVVAQGAITTGIIIPGLVSSGTGEIVQNITQYQGTVFPAGSIHYQLNPTCSPAVFISSLASSDPGTTLESTFFYLSGNVVAATLGFPESAIDGRDINSWRSQIPQGLVIGVEQCLQACNLPPYQR